MSIALDDWDTPLGGTPERKPGDFKRDARTNPYVSDPTGATVKPGNRKGEIKWLRYGRPSSFGKEIENTYNLQRWNERQIAIGMTIEDSELTDRLVALAGMDHESDLGKDAADAIVVHAKRLARANLAADRGTHMHQVTEDDDQEADWVRRSEDGEVLDLPRATQKAMLEAWRLMLMAYDLEMLDVERRVVHDRWRQAGTLDRRVRLRRAITFSNGVALRAGTVLLLDLKTGKLHDAKGKSKIDQGYWHSYAVQCVTYADSVPYDCDTDTRGEWDEPMDRDWALLAHLPVDEALAGKATCRLVLVNITAARLVVEDVVLKAKEWQKRRDLFALPHADEPTIEVAALNEPADLTLTPEDPIVEQLVESINRVAWDRPPVSGEGPFIKPQQRDDLQNRVKELNPRAYALLGALAKEAHRAGHPFAISSPTTRRWHIYRALLRLATHFGEHLEEDHIRATLALVSPEVQQPGIFLGPAIGSLELDEAERFVEATLAVLASDPALTFDDAGRPTWAGVDTPAA